MDKINPDCRNIMQIFNIEFGGIPQSLGLEGLKYKRIQYCACLIRVCNLVPYIYFFFFPMAQRPLLGQDFLIIEASRSHHIK